MSDIGVLAPGAITKGLAMSVAQPRRLGGQLVRLLAASVATAVCSLGALVVVAAPAHAAASGALLLKNSGSLYTASSVVHFGLVPGGTAKTVGVKVVNTGYERQQFKVAVSDNYAYAGLYVGSTQVRSPYYTPYIEPGQSLTLNVKISLIRGANQGSYDAWVELRDPDTNTQLAQKYMVAHATYQTGTTHNDLFLKTGTQPYAGGSVPFQEETANALKVGNIASFKLRLQNNGSTTASISLSTFNFTGCASAFPLTVKQGTRNVTGAVQSGSYTTGPLAPRAKVDLTVSVKRVTAVTHCQSTHHGFNASGPYGGISQFAHVVSAA